ncbi:hypothetical protein B0H14DRAFT_3857229 [Mycena olivaceomarginata]|nr:hypothetical protein B0H14DRAFT_3857229 [Mycena olivaceomarginata]
MMSSNPPSSFRIGDWMCQCAAHNFRRNLSCIGCGCPRADVFVAPDHDALRQEVSLRPWDPLSCNHRTSPSFTVMDYLGGPAHSSCAFPPPFPASDSRGPHHGLPKKKHITPSGRAFAIGGRVQNISSDPMSPLIMFWPDNEPFPEPGQIRPMGVPVTKQPPILNTGNTGPILHQPGDWICHNCNYLNWRRRKVCQTYFPSLIVLQDAEGNGESILPAAQAKRIVTTTLTQTELRSGAAPAPSDPPHRIVDFSQPPHFGGGETRYTPVHSSQSNKELGSQFMSTYCPTPQQCHARSTNTCPDIDTYAPATIAAVVLADTSVVVLCRWAYSEAVTINASPLTNIWRLEDEERHKLCSDESAINLPALPDLRFLTLRATVHKAHVPDTLMYALATLPTRVPQAEVITVVIHANEHRETNFIASPDADAALTYLQRLHAAKFILVSQTSNGVLHFRVCVEMRLPLAREARLHSFFERSWYAKRRYLDCFEE